MSVDQVAPRPEGQAPTGESPMPAQPVTDVRVKLVESQEEWSACKALRVRVFVQEQGVPLEEEFDEHDASALHAVALADSRVVGTGRLYSPSPGQYQIGRMAVEPAFRRRGIGGRVLEFLEECARRRGASQVILHAQTYVLAFYLRHGYVAEGRPFMEAGIQHVRMAKPLGAAGAVT